MFELLFEGIVSLMGGVASFLSGIYTQKAADKTISIKKLFILIFLLLTVVMISIEVSCLFNSSCMPFSWKTFLWEILACFGAGLLAVGLIKISFFFKKN